MTERRSVEKDGVADPFLDSEEEALDLPELKRDPEAVYRTTRARTWRPWLSCAGRCFLALGWLVAVALVAEMNYSTLWPASPLPTELSKTVKRTFALDERYIGPSEEANDHWEALIAGAYAVRPPHGTLLIRRRP